MSQPSPAAEGAERRASVRYPCNEDGFGLDNTCRPVGTLQSETWTASVRDMSTGGVGLLVNRRFEPGTLLVVELQDNEQASSRTILVKVVRANGDNKNGWMLGCEFVNKLTEGELLSLM